MTESQPIAAQPGHFERYPLLLAPYFSPRPWGGELLRTRLGKDAPRGEKIGEAWELSDHPNGPSSIANGPYEGRLFGDLYKTHGHEMCATPSVAGRFPLLVKYLDAQGDLSIQVHPENANAPPGERGKTECWYIIDCPEGTEILCGLEPGVGRDELARATETGEFAGVIQRRAIQPGSFVFNPAGTVHAILGGTLVCEIQQSSDTTYRLWDWYGRERKEDALREGLRVTNYEAGKESAGGLPAAFVLNPEQVATGGTLVANAYFDVKLKSLSPGETDATWRVDNPHGTIVNVVQGSGEWRFDGVAAGMGEAELGLGQTWFVPAGLDAADLRAGDDGIRLLLSRSHEMA